VTNNQDQLTSLSVAIFGAILIHVFAALAAIYFDLDLITQKEKTIPFRLLSQDRHATQSQQQEMSQAENRQAANDYLSTLNQSSFEIHDSSVFQDDTGRKDTAENQSKQNTDSPQVKSPTSNNAKKSSSSSQFFQGLKNIFSSEKQNKALSENQQISTKSAEQLSNYEITLLKKLQKDVLYDQFHAVMKANKKDRLEYVLTLTLLSNGAIKNAQVKQSSGIQEIDKLAKQAAYRASPFPAPPKSDATIDFRYDIPIMYQPFKDES